MAVLTCLVAAATTCIAASTTASEPRPNIVLIISDDAGWADFGVNPLGNEETPTPAFDAIAGRGVWCSAVYATSICAPSRARIFLGMHGQRTGFDDNDPGNLDNTDDVLWGLRLEDRTLFQHLNEAGYHVGYIGKWHLGMEPDIFSGSTLIKPGNQPPRLGIDSFYGLLCGGRTYWLPATNNYKMALRELWLGTNNIVRTNVVENDFPEGTYLTDVLADAAANYITERHAEPAPFFLTASFTAPHGPVEYLQSDFDDPRIANLAGLRRQYAAMMIALDRGVQKILDRLHDPDQDGSHNDSIRDNTLVFFVNDNGGQTTTGAVNVPLFASKGTTWEGGLRVMMAAAGPGIPPDGAEFDQPIDIADLFPTIAAAAGSPLGNDQFTDGRNLLPYLSGTADPAALAERPIFYRNHRRTTAGLRLGDWKLTIERDFLEPALYNLSTDISETTRLDLAYPEVTEYLLDIVTAFEAEYIKPRFGRESIEPFDHYTWRPEAMDANWSDAEAWHDSEDPLRTATLEIFDTSASLTLTFPTHNEQDYVANNDLTRLYTLGILLNSYRLAGQFAGPADRTATLDGNPVVLVDTLDGTLPTLRLDAAAPEFDPARFTFDIAQQLRIFDDLVITGDGNQHFLLSGSLAEERPDRSVTKIGNAALHIRGQVLISRSFRIENGDIHVEDNGQIHAERISIDGGRLVLTGSPQAAPPDMLADDMTLAIRTADSPRVVLNYSGTETVEDLMIDDVPLPTGIYDSRSHPGAFDGAGRIRVARPCSAADLVPNGTLDFFDVLQYLALFDAQDPLADLAPPQGNLDYADVLEYLALFAAGCD